jgi:hypothetical protein
MRTLLAGDAGTMGCALGAPIDHEGRCPGPAISRDGEIPDLKDGRYRKDLRGVPEP